VTHTHALFADQSQSILANRMELSGQGRACNGSAEAAHRAVVYVIGEQPDLVAQQSSRRRVLSHPHGRFERKATEWLMDQNAALARILRDALLRELTNAHGRTLGARPHNGARKGRNFPSGDVRAA